MKPENQTLFVLQKQERELLQKIRRKAESLQQCDKRTGAYVSVEYLQEVSDISETCGIIKGIHLEIQKRLTI